MNPQSKEMRAKELSEKAVYECQCANCRQSGDHPDKAIHAQMNLLLSRLSEAQRRWYVALEAKKWGRGGAKRMAEITGLHVNTIRRGRQELEAGLSDQPTGRVRQPGGGRWSIEKKAKRGGCLGRDH
jgi:hypothetical protein